MEYELIQHDKDDLYDPAPFISYARRQASDKAERDPDVGDSVHLWHEGQSRCHAALVVDVQEPLGQPVTVAVQCFAADGSQEFIPVVHHAEKKRGGTWHWPCGGH
ncbi:hypothetical protein [Streptomyces himalayensis]|uniref:Uncharacterized protein n=1 Tax=Streptomyces himalayensis subsp. himalayensis TaxID=2756131 RepID=A0A7W0DUG4_9ACTN|nr:hypothetical protein [Streptomyces himalayensis]MBA2951445.1 hypothetical protein [Streptomyces himalayensis subsp. himalayensis]